MGGLLVGGLLFKTVGWRVLAVTGTLRYNNIYHDFRQCIGSGSIESTTFWFVNPDLHKYVDDNKWRLHAKIQPSISICKIKRSLEKKNWKKIGKNVSNF